MKREKLVKKKRAKPKIARGYNAKPAGRRQTAQEFDAALQRILQPPLMCRGA